MLCHLDINVLSDTLLLAYLKGRICVDLNLVKKQKGVVGVDGAEGTAPYAMTALPLSDVSVLLDRSLSSGCPARPLQLCLKKRNICSTTKI